MLVEQAFQAAEAEVKRLEGILSDYDSESETRLLTTRAVDQAVAVSDDLWRVLEASDRWHRQSEGAFDASLGALTRLWRQSRRGGKIPDAQQLREALEHSGWRHVQLSATDKTLRFDLNEVYLDFGAIGKGYIVDQVFELLTSKGLECGLVNISGNMRCGTAPPGREGWRIAIAPLEKDGKPLREIVVQQCSIATSGDLWQYLILDGVRRSHILDPHTGIGVPGPLSATIIAPLAADADAAATTACILGPERGRAWIQAFDDLELLIAQRVGDDLEVVVSPKFPAPVVH
jgi:thiamine biosynthesis lipoprotein